MLQVIPITATNEEMFLMLDLTANTLLSLRFLAQFPYEDGDTCVLVDLPNSLALVRLNRAMATLEQLALLRLTPAIAGYVFKERAEISGALLQQPRLLSVSPLPCTLAGVEAQ